METVFTSSGFQWLHDTTDGRRVIPPEELIEYKDDNGDSVIGPDGPVMVPPEGWAPTFEDVELDTVVFIDMSPNGQPTGSIFKFAFTKETLTRFIGTFIEHLDVDGRVAIRERLDAVGGVIKPELILTDAQRQKLRIVT